MKLIKHRMKVFYNHFSSFANVIAQIFMWLCYIIQFKRRYVNEDALKIL